MTNFVSLRLIFDQHPAQFMRDTHRNLYNPDQIRIPPAWALGQYHLVTGFEDSDQFVRMATLYSQIKWPLEGFILDLNFTEWESLRFNPDRVAGGNVDNMIQYLNQRNLTLFQNMKAGIPKRTTGANYLVGNNSAINYEGPAVIGPDPVTGLDSQGEVIYADYYKNHFTLTAYQEAAFAFYERTYKEHVYGV